MASVSQYDEKRWRASFYDSTKTPKRKALYWKRKSFYKTYGLTKKEAERKAWELETKHKSGEIDLWDDQPEIKPLRISEAIEIWKRYASKVLAQKTKDSRTHDLNKFEREFGNSYLHNIPEAYINKYVNGPDKLATRKHRRAIIISLYKALQEAGYDYSVSIKVLSKKKERQDLAQITQEQWISPEELESICKAHLELTEQSNRTKYKRLNRDMVHVFRIAFYTGLRRSDLLALNRDWLSDDFTTMTIGGKYTPKSQKQETVALIPEATALLKQHIDIFPFKCLPNHLTIRFRKAADKALPKSKRKHIHLHSLRHSFVMYCLDVKRYPERIIKQLTRHEDHRSFAKYTHNDVHSVLQYISESG